MVLPLDLSIGRNSSNVSTESTRAVLVSVTNECFSEPCAKALVKKVKKFHASHSGGNVTFDPHSYSHGPANSTRDDIFDLKEM